MLQTTKKLSDNRFYRALKELTKISLDDNLARNSYDFLVNMTVGDEKTIKTYFNVSTLEFSNRPIVNDTLFLFSFFKMSFEKFKVKLEKRVDELIASKNINSDNSTILLSSGDFVLEQFSENIAIEIIKSELSLASFFGEAEFLSKNIVFETDETRGKDVLYLFKYDSENVFIKKEILNLFKGRECFILDIYKGIFEEARAFREEYSLN
jgi:hypothetical protein